MIYNLELKYEYRDFNYHFGKSNYYYDNRYQNYSIIETEEYSKECLNNYFIKVNEICPITEIYVNYDSKVVDNQGYNLLRFDDFDIYYKKYSRYGKLYNNPYYIDQYYSYKSKLSFNSTFDYSNINAIKYLEDMKLVNPFKKLKKFCEYSDILWIPFFIASFMYYLIENKDDKEWNYFRIIDYSLQLIMFILFIVRYIFFVDVKNYFRTYHDMVITSSYLIPNRDKYILDYKPNYYMNSESFPVSIFISFVFLFIFSFFVKSCCCCEYYRFDTEKYLFFNTNRKGRIFYLLTPFLPVYLYFSIKNVVKDFSFLKNYDNIKYNWNTNPITSIDLDHLKNYEIGHLLTKKMTIIFIHGKIPFLKYKKISIVFLISTF